MAQQRLSEEEFLRLEEIYKLFGSVPRIKMLLRLSSGEATASELGEASGLSQSAASHQIKDLKRGRIIKARREGLYLFYSLDDSHIVRLLENGIEHVKGVCHES